MFSNLGNTPSQQNQGFNNQNNTFNKSSPFQFAGTKTPQNNSGIFGSPNPNTSFNQPATPLFGANKTNFGGTSPFGGGQGISQGINSGFGAQKQVSPFGGNVGTNLGSSNAIPLPAPAQSGSNIFASQNNNNQNTQSLNPFSSASSGGFGTQSNFGFGTNTAQNNPTSSIFGSTMASNQSTFGSNTIGTSQSNTGFNTFGSGGFGQSGFNSGGNISGGLLSTSNASNFSNTGQSLTGFNVSQPSQNIFGQQSQASTGLGSFGFNQGLNTNTNQVGQFSTTGFGQPASSSSGFGMGLSNVSSSNMTSQTGFGQFGNTNTQQSSFGGGFGSNLGGGSSLGGTLGSNIGGGLGTNIGGSSTGGFFNQQSQPTSSAFGQTNLGGQSSFGFGSLSASSSNTNAFGLSSNPPFNSAISTSNTFTSQPNIFNTNTGFSASQPSQSNFSLGFNAPANSNSLFSNSGFQQNSMFQSNPQSQQSTGLSTSMPFSNLSNTFSSNNPTFSNFGSSVFNQAQSQPSSNIIGGGLPISSSNLGSNSLFQNSQPSISFLNPVTQTVTFPGIPNISTVINQEPDKTVEVFGYRGLAFRFGPPEYYNTTYTAAPDQSITENGINTVSKNSPFEHENLSNSAYDYDLKLGSVANANNDTELREVPFDTITRLRFSRTQSDLLACASWDSSVSVYKIDDHLNEHLGSKINVTGCVFDLDWISGSNSMVMGSSSGIIYNYDVMSNSCHEFARHSGPIKAVKTCDDYNSNMFVSGSYDGTVKMWDLRSKVCLNTITVSSKILDLDVCKSGLAFITSEREICVYRFNDTNRHVLRKKVETSPFPLRCISMTTFNCRKEGGFVCAVGTCGGKVAVFAQSNNAKEFTFKANRLMHPSRVNSQIACPVHNIEFHPKTYALALGGGDGTVSFWDIQKHSQVHMLNSSSLPVTAISFNSTGRFLAYAIGYDWSRGIRGYKYKTMRPAIFIRRCNEELKYPCPNPVHNYTL